MSNNIFWKSFLITISLNLIAESSSAQSQSLKIVYPPVNHQTTAESIFIIGSAPASGNVIINGKSINRSSLGYFAPSIPLKMGKNQITIRYDNEELNRVITRVDNQPDLEEINNFSANLLNPQVDISKLPNEDVCFSAITPLGSNTTVKLNQDTLPLTPALNTINLPGNASVLIDNNNPISTVGNSWQKVSGCVQFSNTVSNLNPIFVMDYQGKTTERKGEGSITILNPQELQVVEVIAEQGIARTGAGTNYSRLTPLPRGVRAKVTGKEGEWLRLDYGGWIKAEETRVLPTNTLPLSYIRSITSKVKETQTEIIFPLESAVPVSIKQDDDSLTLSLYNIVAQTDTIRFDDNPIIKRFDWYQVNPTQIDYIFSFKSPQQWGYDVRYEGNNLILTINHPPNLKSNQSLNGASILLDPGHGGNESGALGPTGYPEKDVNLIVSKLVAQELEKRGARVYLTRNDDSFVSLGDRAKMIRNVNPTVALSIHYNALPDGGNAEKTKGVSTFWYHPQAQDLAVYLHNYLINQLDRDSAGIFWNNLALTRPHQSPTVLLELGFMINPEEFEWITNSSAQKQLAFTLADGIQNWILSKNSW
ncbi:N-acetylmuramoyl-L-alanine amidase [Cyanobacterium aponinum AL20118]|uniref:N-acetylmuramoyl-L-alanine amidase n=1 Tax=Cyanobacterium aponinum AL20115 TaxID=3090662 RepID=A0AAF1C5W1_9CHRO|nr:N-acetylmuramoyl-L-alanine amidase [Cyanobacterium aponinum]WPF89696.1 N-acetylmuramoyl-L-alanine amidase [Cyanobacterium aponinum AL20115]